jgi:hypothetical protein
MVFFNGSLSVFFLVFDQYQIQIDRIKVNYFKINDDLSIFLSAPSSGWVF